MNAILGLYEFLGSAVILGHAAGPNRGIRCCCAGFKSVGAKAQHGLPVRAVLARHPCVERRLERGDLIERGLDRRLGLRASAGLDALAQRAPVTSAKRPRRAAHVRIAPRGDARSLVAYGAHGEGLTGIETESARRP
jgi:hypothetical protein